MSSGKQTVNVGTRGVATLLTNPDGASLKRIAWAFGCARKDSDEERALYHVLVDRVAKVRAEHEQSEHEDLMDVEAPCAG